MSKTIIRLPTEQFAYIEQEWDVPMTPDMAVEAYRTLAAAYKGEKAGLPPKEWNAWIDTYLLTGTGDANLHSQMAPEQQRIIKAIQLSTKRIKSRTGMEDDDSENVLSDLGR